MNYSDLSDDEFVTKVNDCYKEARQHSDKWRKESREMYAFRAGHQWDEEDISYLEEQNRPAVVFNRAGTIIDAVCGNEVANRQEVRYLPRTQDDGMKSEVATAAAKWVRDNCDAEDEESDAFEDVLICGMGWTETRISYDEDQDGKIEINRMDPLEMYWDPAAFKSNLSDGKWFLRERWLDKDYVDYQWPDNEITPTEGAAPEIDQDIRNADPPFYEREQTGVDRIKNQVRVFEYFWYEYAKIYRVLNPFTNKIEELPEELFKKFKDRIPQAKFVKQNRKVWYRAFTAGQTVLEKEKAPIKEFCSFKCITGKRDAKDRYFYGLMRGIKEPQEWANKFFSQVLHIINSNSKGGFFYETGAIKDPDRARQDLAKPEGMVELNVGGLNKIKERQMFQFPAGIDRMMEFAISSIRDVPGVNLELLGAANRDQAGVLEQQRQRQALTVLAPIFSNLRRYRKEQGRLLLAFIREFIPPDRLIRVVGDEGAQFVPLVEDPLTAEYDIIVEQSPTSPNVKTEAWVAVRDVLPVLQQAGIQPPKSILDILPIPESIIQKWKQESNGLPPQVQEQIQKMQEIMNKLSQENQALKQDQSAQMVELQMKRESAAVDVRAQQQKFQADQQKAFSELELKKAIAEQEFALEVEKMNREHQLEIERMNREHALKLIEIQKQAELDAEKLKAQTKISSEKNQMDAAAKLQPESPVEEKKESQSPVRDIVVNVENKQPKKFNITRNKDGLIEKIEGSD